MMTSIPDGCSRAQPDNRGYLMVLFVIIVAFVGVVGAMHVSILASVGTTSRAFDAYRQMSAEATRLQRAVTEAVLAQRQIAVPTTPASLADALNVEIGRLGSSGATITPAIVPAELPTVVTFPSFGAPADVLTAAPADLEPFLTPELAMLTGPRVVAYPEQVFVFTIQRPVLEVTRTYRTEVRTRLIAVPLTRFPVAAYDLPAEIGMGAAGTASPSSILPVGLVPARDTAFVGDLQANHGVLPYHYRRRALLAVAYQYVFSQAYVDRVSEYAGITHFCSLDPGAITASLAGMSQSGSTTTWDLGTAGAGTYTTITMTRDAAVVYTEEPGRILRLCDTRGDVGAAGLLILALGPANSALGQLTVELSTIARPIVIIGYNVRVTAAAGVGVNGALFLDPASTMAPSGPVTLGHLSFWAGTAHVPEGTVTTVPLPLAAETIAPRVVYAATAASRL